MAPMHSNAVQAAEAIVKLVAMPFGIRPLRVHVDVSQFGATSAIDTVDHVHEELLRDMGLGDLLRPSSSMPPGEISLYV